MLHVAIATRSERGHRDVNEDKVWVRHHGTQWMALLADGAGGHQGGAEASRRAIAGLHAALADAGSDFTPQALTSAVLAAHALVQGTHDKVHGSARMHTTVVALWIDTASASALWSHVGDSRLYRVQGGRLELLTVDDSVVQRMLDAGLITLQQAATHPHRNHLIAALGIDSPVDPHTLAQPVPLADGDAFLLCSDGWWGALDDAAVVASLNDAQSADGWLEAMRQHIEGRARPRQDNFSAIAVWIGQPVEDAPTAAAAETSAG